MACVECSNPVEEVIDMRRWPVQGRCSECYASTQVIEFGVYVRLCKECLVQNAATFDLDAGREEKLRQVNIEKAKRREE